MSKVNTSVEEIEKDVGNKQALLRRNSKIVVKNSEVAKEKQEKHNNKTYIIKES